MSKKYFLFFATSILAIVLFVFLIDIKNANAQFQLPSDCDPAPWGGISNHHVCTGSTPPSGCTTIPPLGDCRSNSCDCTAACDAAGATSLRYGTSPNYSWYCCDGTGYGECTLLGQTTPIVYGSGTRPPETVNWWEFWHWGDELANLGQNLLIGLPIALFAIISYLLMLIAGTIAGLLGTLMVWMINASLNVFVVPGKAVEVVNIGWQLSRDLINMVFILILVFIGLATILRLQSYQVKKTLPLLVIMALLVNFSGVIVGIIVDISNLVTGFFVSNLNTFSSSFSLIWANTQGLVTGLGAFFSQAWANPEIYVQNVAAPLGRIITTAAFFVVLDITLFVIMLVFFLRTINLWIAVILAPIAFASYILPATRGFWNSWWKNLIQWSIVGIPISFFLYLSNAILLNQGQISAAIQPGGGNWLANFIAQMLAPATVILLLWFGITTSIAGAPSGAKGMINWGTKAGVAIGAYGLGKARGNKVVSRAEEGIRKRMESNRFLNRLPGFRPGTYETERARQLEAARKPTTAIPDNPDGNKALMMRARKINSPVASTQERQQAVAAMEELAKRKELSFLDKAGKHDDKKAKEMLSAYARLGGNIKPIYVARPDLAPHLGFKVDDIDPVTKKVKIDPKTGKTIQRALNPLDPTDVAKAKDIAMSKIEPGEWTKNLQKDALNDIDTVTLAALDKRKFDQSTRHMKAEQKRIFKKTILDKTKIFSGTLTPDQKKTLTDRMNEVSSKVEWKV